MLHFLDTIGITGTGRWYNFWSGSGSDIGQLALLGALFRYLNCHEPGCWRLGHHVHGTVVCRKHRRGRDHTGPGTTAGQAELAEPEIRAGEPFGFGRPRQ